MSTKIPNEPPPSYATATGSSTASSAGAAGSSTSATTGNSRLDVPNKGRIPLEQRRSMEDQTRSLPPGWVRQFDEASHHQFFVDTTKEPPRSIWHHPYDDDEYLRTLSSEERERLEQESLQRRNNPTKAEIIDAHSDDEDGHVGPSTGAIPAELPPRPDGKGKAPDHRSFGRKFKDKVTGMTHEQRVEERQKRAEQEQQAYEQHIRIRQAMVEASQTGKPVFVGKDNTGRDVYVEPPYAGPIYPGSGQYPGSYGYNPYAGGAGSYTTPNARYIRPAQPYGRPYGSGYGYGSGVGGMGTGLALGGGLGLLLGTSLLI